MSPDQLYFLPLINDLQIPEMAEGKVGLQVNLWLNLKTAVSQAHYDSYNGVLCVVHGKKRVRLWPSSAILHANPLFSETYNGLPESAVLPPAPLTLTIRRGQALFIPEGWWHEVTSAPNTLAVSFWWKGFDQQILRDTAKDRLDAYLLRATLRRVVEQFVRRKVDAVCETHTLTYDVCRTEEITAVESSDAELIAEILAPASPINQLTILASLTGDTVKRILRSLQNSGDLPDFILHLQSLAAFTLEDKLSQSDKAEDNSEFYRELWEHETGRDQLVSRLMTLKKTALEQAAHEVFSTFFDR